MPCYHLALQLFSAMKNFANDDIEKNHNNDDDNNKSKT